MAETDRAAVLRRALEACASGDIDQLPDLFTDDVSAWSPVMLVDSRDGMAEALSSREEAFTDIAVEIDALDVFDDKGLVEFRLTARFSEPFVVDDTVLEPNGHLVVLGAAVVVDFDGDRISAFRNYFDEASLLEQLLVPA